MAPRCGPQRRTEWPHDAPRGDHTCLTVWPHNVKECGHTTSDSVTTQRPRVWPNNASRCGSAATPKLLRNNPEATLAAAPSSIHHLSHLPCAKPCPYAVPHQPYGRRPSRQLPQAEATGRLRPAAPADAQPAANATQQWRPATTGAQVWMRPTPSQSRTLLQFVFMHVRPNCVGFHTVGTGNERMSLYGFSVSPSRCLMRGASPMSRASTRPR
mmetsp:Transcript_18850/g.56175  ORF Transcript_18850/g.56175 Transcript_18850/m.56175 type:complete len:213 (+) Transcript_18850:538-1176(+)|eukprot:365292-Chlamydomonas_euryale.AAC.2